MGNEIEWTYIDSFYSNRCLGVWVGLYEDEMYIIKHTLSGYSIWDLSGRKDTVYALDNLDEAKSKAKEMLVL